MLLITRRVSESIIINGTIEVKIIDIKGGRVKLGFEYPEGNSVYREELYKKIQDENQNASNVDPNKLKNALMSIGKKEK
ncbi:MAG: carbon storage regulator CsrA [Proteobacteria bacterium]|nr:carbon storage regulator CsrA [Pseudomonadota bacterium]